MPRNRNQSDDDHDLLWGVSAIADHIRLPKRQTQYLIDKQRIPVKHLGPKTIVGSRTKINTALKSDESTPQKQK
jgi:hypothetical protein